jgi:hypothetical protein
MRVAAASTVFFLLGGCFPSLPHPTRVEPAFRVGPHLSFTHVSDSSAASERPAKAVAASVDVIASIGIRDTSRLDSPGILIGGTAGFSGYGATFYGELPRPHFGALDAGLGIAVHRGAFTSFTPYVQFGRQLGEFSWFARNAVFFIGRRDSLNASPLWVPTVGVYRHHGRGRESSLYVAGVIGPQPRVERYCVFFECFAYSNSYTRAYLIVGSSFTIALSTEARPYPGAGQ